MRDQTNKLDGHKRWVQLWWWKAPKQANGMKVLALFDTRRECLAWIKEEYGYIAHRKDLRVEPHCWRVPRAKRVTVTVSEIDHATALHQPA